MPIRPADWGRYDVCPRCRAAVGSPCRGRATTVHGSRPVTMRTRHNERRVLDPVPRPNNLGTYVRRAGS
jgi:hypothetical protein